MESPDHAPQDGGRPKPTQWTKDNYPKVTKPKGTVGGRMKSLMTLDAMLNAAGNQQLLRVAMQQAFVKDPLRFFRKFVMPLLPKDYMIKAAGEQGAVRWMTILETYPNPLSNAPPSDTTRTLDSSPSIEIEISDSEPSAADAGGERPALPPPS